MNIESVNQREYGNAYCLASCYLAIANYFGHSLTMEDLKDEGIVASNGFVNRWGDYFTRGGLKTFSISGIKSAIDAENPVIIKGKSSSTDHYVVAYDYSGDTIKIMDPWDGVFGNLGSTTLKSWSGYNICT